YLKPGIS
ncbi:hypothetical protein KL933_005408, partial [Ogataea haglerorum]